MQYDGYGCECQPDGSVKISAWFNGGAKRKTAQELNDEKLAYLYPDAMKDLKLQQDVNDAHQVAQNDIVAIPEPQMICA
jgi:hypothetical protein